MRAVLYALSAVIIFGFSFYFVVSTACSNQVKSGEVVRMVTIDDREIGKQTKLVTIKGKSQNGSVWNREVEVDDFGDLNLGDNVRLEVPRIRAVRIPQSKAL